MNKYNFQVGDFCRHADGSLAKVVKVDGDNFACKIGDSQNLWSYNNKFYPIEITEEWLELNEIFLDTKCSVVMSGEEFKYWYTKDHRLEINNLSNTIYDGYSAEVRMFRAHMDNDHYETIGCLDVQYTHQIQHLCRDCKYDFEPKFK